MDAVYPAGEGWRLLRLGAGVQARVPDGEGGTFAAPTWLRIAGPSGPFRPVQFVQAQRGHFYLVDAASARLCLYDTAASLLSTFPLPREFTPFPAGRAAVFRGADGAFTFLDYAAGEAWQFADRQTADAGSAQWIPRGRVKLPAGTRDCTQAPGASDLLCRGPGGTPLRFDGALNRAPALALRADGSSLRVEWDTTASEWRLEASGRDAEARPLFRFYPASRRWEPSARPNSPAVP